MATSNYDADFYAWANEQSALLRAGKLASADIENIAEEIESMGRSEKRELTSRLIILLLHLLKWKYQPGHRNPSWETSISVQRIQTSAHMADNPSLKTRLPEAMAIAYQVAVLEAAQETRLSKSVFPAACPFTFEQVADIGFWPE